MPCRAVYSCIKGFSLQCTTQQQPLAVHVFEYTAVYMYSPSAGTTVEQHEEGAQEHKESMKEQVGSYVDLRCRK
jgi:hypothetical protein